MRFKVKALASLLSALLFVGMGAPAQARVQPREAGVSPALCGAGDVKEPGIQGETPAGQTASYNCGVRLMGQAPVGGNVQGFGNCAYVRSRPPAEVQITVVDVSDPTKPVVVGSPLPVQSGSETLRVVVTKTRAIMVSGSTVFDVSDCLHPKLKGQIKWPNTTLPGVTARNLPHDIRINREGTKVYASFGLWEADLSNLDDPESWKITDHRCELAAQIPGPWQDLHREAIKAGRSLCDDATKPAPRGANYSMGGSPLQASLLWPQVSHSPDLNADDTRLYVGDQAGGNSGLWAPTPKVRIVDLTQAPVKILGEVDGGGHGLDWFRTGGREYVLHSNERGQAQAVDNVVADSCHPYPRPYRLGWAFEAFVSDVTVPSKARRVSTLQLAINDPAFCAASKASGRDTSIAYHLIDNPLDAKFAMVNFGDAGLRIFDIRHPEKPVEVAYFNHGMPTHAGVGYYDAQRGLIYAASASTFWVLQVEPQVRARLGL